ncbi:colanic acid/amylovoran biosynthesis protein [Chromohalobacter canadensis]|uniref:Colanic acid/amylovoran biosynthesis protein n=1 Tax=Chromohalobacter canadensis TaxID=141389 RepID=A0A285VW16_9GAMM|nr:polysaccharide pyruvyl transferase family protein [Chromohalobacter canadensis]SOC57446.1 colanic acid/amylovoran biosynthesis protein [Chromohalobacter canadensis]
MIVEIRKAGFINKGAELMLYAVMQKVKERYPDAILVMAPTHSNSSQPFKKFAPLGLFPKASLWRKGVQFGSLANIVPKKIREMYGIILDSEVDVVLDASGFSYSDQCGVGSSRELASSSRKWKKKGTKVILLPQALGPYEKPKIQGFVKEWVVNADLIFAREEDSYHYLSNIVGELDKIKLFPDFTNLIEGVLPDCYDSSDRKVALVPNYRMIDRTVERESEAYLPFMINCAKYLVKKNAKPFLLVHDGENDRMLADNISEAVGGIPIVKETDPRKIKGIIGSCDATVGSRFHGLVSALSQGVPSLATGWSHKYTRLFEEYGFKEGVVSVLDSERDIEYKIDLITDDGSAEKLKGQFNERSKILKKSSEEMWMYVFKQMDQKI